MPVLIVPGLLSGPQGHDTMPAEIMAWTRRGRRQQHIGDIEATLLEVHGYRSGPVAVAALTYFGLTGKEPGTWAIRADPVYLHPRREQLILISGEQLDLPGDHARQLAAAVGSVLSGYGLTLVAEDPMQWVVLSQHAPGLRTHDLWSVSGHDIDPFLPGGAESTAWLRILTEVQMALHQTDVNRLRVHDGRLEINSVWFWGPGTLSPPPIRRPEAVDAGTLFTDDAVATGFAHWTGTRVQSLPPDYRAFRAETIKQGGTPETAVIQFGGGYLKLALQDEKIHRDYLAEWSRCWGQPLHQALRTGELTSLTLIDPGSVKIAIHKNQLKPWWRRIIPAARSRTPG